ncbi:hypothetical protein RAS1_36780 [Phycisphaerae bacterium RAS1]|nr:hypothetical protein RAS1_36780 [Phycisphaerae bacterium RAS1]
MKKFLLSTAAAAMLSTPALAALIDTRVDTTPGGATIDGAISADEYGLGNSYSYGGGGGGFGGTLGAGTLYMNSTNTDLQIGFQPGNNLNDNVVIFLDTRAGGFTDAMMGDRADGGRRGSSEISLDGNDSFDPGFLPDFSIVIGNFGIVTFELAAGGDGSLIFVDYNGTFTGSAPTPREYNIGLAAIASGPAANIDFFAAYTSDSAFASNESIPAWDPLNVGGNPGFGTAGTENPGYGNYDRFVTAPEPASLALLGLAALAIRRR